MFAKMKVVMPKSSKVPKSPNEGRKSAYFARNKLAILKSTQEVLASIGHLATVDQVAEHAEVSVSTIYKHFKTKEVLFQAAFTSAFESWEKWVFETIRYQEDPLVRFVLPLRLFPRLKRTHSVYAAMAVNNSAEIPLYITKMTKSFQVDAIELAKNKILTVTDLDIRLRFVLASLAEILLTQILNPKAKESDVDKEIEILLNLLGINPAKASKLCSMKLPDLTAQN
jgi:AcrR family transcriptional regulator